MAHRLEFSNVFDAYEAIKAKLLGKGYDVGDYTEIQYGIQFFVTYNSVKSLVRIFYSKKKGCTLDLSQFKVNVSQLEHDLGLESDDSEVSETTNVGQIYCLCVGIDAYKDEKFGSLKYAANDAQKLFDKISEKCGYGTGTTCLTNEYATKQNVIKWMEQLKSIVRPDDTVIFLFAGHGEFHRMGGAIRYYLITHDTNSEQLEETGLNMDFIHDLISGINCGRKILFLDTCYSGGISRGLARGTITDEAKKSVFERMTDGNYIIITSSQPNQKSWECEKVKQGVFSYFLIKGLCGAVESNKGQIDLTTLYIFLHQSVSLYVHSNYNQRQEPKFFGGFTGSFTLPLLIDLEELNASQQYDCKEQEFSFESVRCIGIDESGKGDYFGGLTVAAVYVKDRNTIERLKKMGVKDSKRLKDQEVKIMADQIKNICDCEIIGITPPRYNQLYSNMQNMNKILAWGHAQSLERVLQRNQECTLAISDKFTASGVLLHYLKEKGKDIELIQRPKAEENIAVAAASILARAKFVKMLEFMEDSFKHQFSKGANEEIRAQAVQFLEKGKKLEDVAKVHFRTHREIIEMHKQYIQESSYKD